MGYTATYFASLGRRCLWACVCLLFAVPLAAQEVVQTLAGAASDSGYTNGPAKDARFNDPAGLIIDTAGNLYLADSQNHVIRKITPAGIVTTLAGTPGQPGTNNGTGALARFDTPSGIALDAAGNLFVCDTANHTIRKVTPDGLVTTFAGLAGEADGTNGVGSEARFNGPLGIAVAIDGNIFVADSGNHAIRKITSSGVVTTLAGELEIWGSNDGVGETAHFNGPVGLALDGQGNVIVADANNHTLRKVTPGGAVTTLAGLAGADGCVDGTGSTARFCQPANLVMGRNGVLYVADSLNHVIRRVTAEGAVSTFAGWPGLDGATDGSRSQARFFNPYGLAIDAGGNLYISDTYNQTLRLLLVPFRVELNASQRQIVWDSVPGKKYRVQYKEAVNSLSWTDLGGLVTATGPAASAEDHLAAGQQRFYRVILVE